MWCDVMWCDVMWGESDVSVMWWYEYPVISVMQVMWCDVMWFDVMWCDVMWCDVHYSPWGWRYWARRRRCLRQTRGRGGVSGKDLIFLTTTINDKNDNFDKNHYLQHGIFSEFLPRFDCNHYSANHQHDLWSFLFSKKINVWSLNICTNTHCGKI